MDSGYYKKYEPVFGVWRITRLIGEGSFGKVFEMEREDFGYTYKAALKAITVPESPGQVSEALSEGMDEASVRTYFGSFVQDLVREFALMSRLKGNSHVVSYENHQVVEHADGIGWDILIQMELLTPLNQYIRDHVVTRQDVIQLGIHLCKALELCQKYNIIHRDVKPENIFISEAGDFKLGDFGIARTVEKTTSGLSKKGTYTYMAPEVYKGEAYGSTVDIYSLGIVLYRLLNGNRTPFLPAAPAPITHADRENALLKRFSGAPLPPSREATGRLAEIVLKACAYDPKERYSSPLQMRQELEAILYSREEQPYIYPEGDQVPQDSVDYVKTGEEPFPSGWEATQRETAGGWGGNGAGGEWEAPGGDRTTSDFGRTASDWGKTVSDFGRTASDFGRTTGDFGRTTSDFGGPASDFGGTRSDFGNPASGGGTSSRSLDPSWFSARNISKKVGDSFVMRDFSLDIRQGEWVLVACGRDAGKRLCRMIAGLDSTTAGDWYLNGRRINGLLPVERRIGLLSRSDGAPGDPGGVVLLPHMTVEAQIQFALANRKKREPSVDVERLTAWFLEQMDLQCCAKSKPKQLTEEQKVRLAMVRSLAGNPEMLVLEDPLRSLSRESAARIYVDLQRCLSARAESFHFTGSVLITAEASAPYAGWVDREIRLPEPKTAAGGTPGASTAAIQSRTSGSPGQAAVLPVLRELLPSCATGVLLAATKAFLAPDIPEKERELYEKWMLQPLAAKAPDTQGQKILGIFRQGGNLLSKGHPTALKRSLLFLERGLVLATPQVENGGRTASRGGIALWYVPYNAMRDVTYNGRCVQFSTVSSWTFQLEAGWYQKERLRDLLARLSQLR